MSEHTAENGLHVLATYCGRGPCWKGAGHEGPCEPGSRLDPRRTTVNPPGQTVEIDRTCAEHGDALIWEPGGDDMPTIYGRWYCPACQQAFLAAVDALPDRFPIPPGAGDGS
jgi:hypothetical protein